MDRKMNHLLMAALMMGANTVYRMPGTRDPDYRPYTKPTKQEKPEVEPRHCSNPHLHEYNINGTIITAKNKNDARRIYQSRKK